MNAHPVIEYRGVGKQFAGTGGASSQPALLDFNLSVERGELLCLLGPSGCGKSTVLNMTAGFEPCTTGQILVNGRAVETPGPERCVVFQEAMLFPWLNVIDNVTFGPRMAGRAESEYLPLAHKLLADVGLGAFGKHRSYELSGGMRQRVAIARAWIMKPDILLMDEPFGALDAQTRLMMQEMLVGMWERNRTTTVFVTHDIDEAMFLADRICVMTARPGGVRSVVEVPFARPRNYEAIVEEPAFGSIKRRVVHEVREETLKMM
ncbi:MAG: ABC transporter ATP-binding protein [Proteobacteria bacterium]|nr:MAG: ABC transporter ATP-binding protein [Pseudomonadota bacterium]